jgi:hypothetical protein
MHACQGAENGLAYYAKVPSTIVKIFTELAPVDRNSVFVDDIICP